MATAHELTEYRLPTELSSDTTMRLADLQQPSLKKRVRRYLARFVIAFGMGVSTTLAWQSHGHEIRATIAGSSPQLGWLAPQAALAETAQAAPITPASASPETQQLQELLTVNLVAMQQSIEQLTKQLVASQQQVASENSKLKQEIFAKLSSPRPAAASPRKPAPLAPPPSLQEPPER